MIDQLFQTQYFIEGFIFICVTIIFFTVIFVRGYKKRKDQLLNLKNEFLDPSPSNFEVEKTIARKAANSETTNPETTNPELSNKELGDLKSTNLKSTNLESANLGAANLNPVNSENNETSKHLADLGAKKVSLNQALSQTRDGFWNKIKKYISVGNQKKGELIEQIEEVLYLSDIGPQVVQRLSEQLEKLSLQDLNNEKLVGELIKNEMLKILSPIHFSEDPFEFTNNLKNKKPHVVLIVGVNGAGKTTTIGKLSEALCSKGFQVLVAAGDTFRAAAGQQLMAWANQAKVEFFSPSNIKDPAAVAYEAIKKAKDLNSDVVLVDTAGRLHTSQNLMEELKKVKRVMEKAMDGAPHDIWLVLDASGGQNAVIQAEQFNQAIGITGLILTKLDGTAKGGMAIGAMDKIKKPILWLGVGEKAKDLKAFNQNEFINALLESEVN